MQEEEGLTEGKKGKFGVFCSRGHTYLCLTGYAAFSIPWASATEIWADSPYKQMGLIKFYRTLKDFYRHMSYTFATQRSGPIPRRVIAIENCCFTA